MSDPLMDPGSNHLLWAMIHELIGDDLEKEQIALETKTACKEGVMAINMGVTGCKGV